MSKKKKQQGFVLVFEHIQGEYLLDKGFTVDDSGAPILKHRLYAYETDRKSVKIYLNSKKKK